MAREHGVDLNHGPFHLQDQLRGTMGDLGYGNVSAVQSLQGVLELRAGFEAQAAHDLISERTRLLGELAVQSQSIHLGAQVAIGSPRKAPDRFDKHREEAHALEVYFRTPDGISKFTTPILYAQLLATIAIEKHEAATYDLSLFVDSAGASDRSHTAFLDILAKGDDWLLEAEMGFRMAAYQFNHAGGIAAWALRVLEAEFGPIPEAH